MNNVANLPTRSPDPQSCRTTSSGSPWAPASGVTSLSGSQWFAVNTLPRSEARARANLERQGFACFSPLLSTTNRSGRRLLTRLFPLFPSYIFVALNLQQPGWRSVDSTYGVRGLVKQAGCPSPLPSQYVQALQDMTNEHGIFSFSSHVEVGDNVRFLRGPLTGFIGTLEQMDSHGRITVLLTLLGHASRVKATAGDIAPAPTTAI